MMKNIQKAEKIKLARTPQPSSDLNKRTRQEKRVNRIVNLGCSAVLIIIFGFVVSMILIDEYRQSSSYTPSTTIAKPTPEVVISPTVPPAAIDYSTYHDDFYDLIDRIVDEVDPYDLIDAYDIDEFDKEL